jgi:S-sulfo-L-cysteine synthase (3-phospho-L-serine-dependent)
MKSHVAFLESNATGSGYEAIRAASDCGHPVTFVTRDLGYYLRPGQLPFPVDAIDRVITCETNDTAAVVAALRPAAHELAALISVGEWYLQGAAEAARQLGLVGQSPDAVRAVRDKSVARTLCASAGVPVPRFARAASAAAARQADVGFPCIVKPLDDAMSHGVRLCRSRDEVAEHATRLLADTRNIRGQRKIPAVLVEEYAEGPEVSVEAFVSSGTAEIVMITDKLLVPPPDFFEAGHAVPAALPPATVRECHDVARRALAAIGYDFGAVHAELRLTETGPKIIEINGRLAGGHITELVKLATGADMTEILIGMHLGQPPPPPRPATRGAAIVFLPGRAGTVRAVTGTDAARSVGGVCDVMVPPSLPGTTFAPPAGNADRVGHVIATGATGAAALVAARQAAAAIHIDMEPTT